MSSSQISAAVAQAARGPTVAQSEPRAAPMPGSEPSAAQSVILSAPAPARNAERPTSPLVDPERMRERLDRAVDELNAMIKSGNRDLSFGVDRVADRYVVTVKDANDGEVVRQIPGEDVLRIAHRMESLKGLLFEDLF